MSTRDLGNPAEQPTKIRKRDRLAVAAFLLLFLIPLLLRGSVLPAGVPAPLVLRKLHNIACLFTHKPEGWSSYYVQIRYPGEAGWASLDQRELFPLEPFGRRTRMHRFLVAWGARPGPRTEDMARWIVREHERRHPDNGALAGIRFTRAWMIPSRDQPPEQGWAHPDYREVPPARRRVIASYTRAKLLGPWQRAEEGAAR
ncbi:hypothetical protein G6O69_36360 [Pseudenhygromyxa sp. WMMC2535]|uniref:hypothetical protein n=1 Tax=Pseudenhygromyxa sp. WMMC2535 TaxID=2712867 RepID=UPI0015539C57|nr:hypothetical protein [Pseudenhygromyxa sp. WMMC2535]NVB43356.1 hypothetical protein [Pseudenhygromyxa sp. WMMC2535]